MAEMLVWSADEVRGLARTMMENSHRAPGGSRAPYIAQIRLLLLVARIAEREDSGGLPWVISPSLQPGDEDVISHRGG